METIVTILLWAAAIYLLTGLVFAVLFLMKGISVVDDGAKGSGIGFRLIILPGIALLWPVLFKKWINALRK